MSLSDKMKNLSIGDGALNITNFRKSMESKIVSVEEEEEIKEESEEEYSYAESFCSDNSVEEPIMKNEMPKKLTKYSSLNDLSAKNSVKSVPKTRSADFSSRFLENKMRFLGLAKVKNMPTRKNMSFSNDETMKIERENQLLLRRIMSQQKPRVDSFNKTEFNQPRLSSSAINRRKFQRKVETDNLVGQKPTIFSSNYTFQIFLLLLFFRFCCINWRMQSLADYQLKKYLDIGPLTTNKLLKITSL